MGYRSDVTLIFYTINKDEVPFAAIKLWFDENYPKETATTDWHAMIETDELTWVMVSYEAVKWYDDYDHVKAVRAAIQRFAETFETDDKQHAAWEMIEIGEELNDNTHTYSEWCDFKLYVERTIRMN